MCSETGQRAGGEGSIHLSTYLSIYGKPSHTIRISKIKYFSLKITPLSYNTGVKYNGMFNAQEAF